MKQIANADARKYVANRDPFKGSNLWGEYRKADDAESSDLYVVYSFGQHYPMWVYDTKMCQWYGNHDRYSRTTSKHRTQTQPVEGSNIRWFDTQTMIQLAIYGYRGLSVSRILYGRRAA